MKRAAFLLLLPVLFIAACAQPAPTRSDTVGLLDKALWTLETFKKRPDPAMDGFRRALKEAKGVVIFPGLLKAGFFLGAEGGNGVMLARRVDGTWGYPGFYSIGAASIGFQFGGQVSEVILILRSRGAVEALIEHQGKLGIDLSVAAGTVGGGLEASITTNLGADILVFSQAAGLYGGASLEGAVLAKRVDMNEAHYGKGATPRAIVLEGLFSTQSADDLRAALADP